MADTMKLPEEYVAEIEDLRNRLDEAEDTLRAIQSGEVDALVVAGPEGNQVYTLKGEERTYRLLVESINEGAVILSPDGTVMYANQAFALMLGTRLERIIGSDIRGLVGDGDWATIDRLIQCGKDCTGTAEIRLRKQRKGELMPANVSLSPLLVDEALAISMVVTDLTERKQAEEKLRLYQENLEELIQTRTEALQVLNEEMESINEELTISNAEVSQANRDLKAEIHERARAEEALRQSEQQLKAVFDASQDAIVLVDDNGRYVSANPAVSSVFGLTPEDLMGRHVSEFMAPGFDSGKAWETFVQTGMFSGEHKLVRADGSMIDAESYSIASVLPGRHLSVVRDITERKQAEEALRESERRYSALFANKINGMAHCRVITDEHGRPVDYWILQVNEAYEQIIGIKKADIEGRRATEVFPDIKNYAYDYIGVYGKIALEGGEIKFEEFFEATGQYLSIYAYSPLPSEFTAIFTDVTDRRRAEEALATAKADAERWSARLESFISSMADGVTLFDADGSAIMMNEAGKAMVGVPDGVDYADWSKYQRLTLDGKPFPPEEAASTRALRGETIRDFRYKLVSPWGKDVVISVSASPVLDARGRVMGATNVFRDITGQIDFEQQQNQLLERERHIAEVLQKALIPDTDYKLPGCEIAVQYEAALDEAQVGGDFYDVFDMGDNRIGILIGDVAGKGLAAAIQVAAARHSFRAYAYIDPRPERVMTLANNALCKDPRPGLIMLTAFFAVVDLDLGVMSYANGGHETPLLRRRDGTVEELAVDGRALGVMEDFTYPDGGVILRPGDLVTMATDGITEARVTSDNMFGLEGMKSFLSKKRRRSADELAQGLLKAAKKHAGGVLKDDAAIVVIGLRRKEKKAP